MKVAFVVQRCGAEVNGGAETLCFQVAQRMRQHWEVEILTTCALDYMRWENFYPEGKALVEGVTTRRFSVDAPRDLAQFDALSEKLAHRGTAATLTEQEKWMRAQGPMSQGLLRYLSAAADDYDAFIFFGYLYATTYFGLPLVKEKALLAPLGHDEWTIHLPMWDTLFSLARAFIFQTPEEQSFLRHRFPQLPLPGEVAGIGVETEPNPRPDEFRTRYDLPGPFLLYAGRVDASKGCGEMFEWFLTRDREAGPQLKLVILGREAMPVPFHDDVISLGFVSESEKWSAMAACAWMILPSRYESLSIALLENWVAGRPAIVNAHSEVLRGHCQRSHGGLWYEDWRECEAIVRTVTGASQQILGNQGRAYVERNYSWEETERFYQETISAALI